MMKMVELKMNNNIESYNNGRMRSYDDDYIQPGDEEVITRFA